MTSTVTPRSASTGAAAMKGSETITTAAPSASITRAVSSAHSSRSVRGVG